MAFPAAGGTTQDNCAAAWETARKVAASIKQRATSLRTQSAAGPMSVGPILDFSTFLADMRLSLVRSASVTGIVAYGQEQVANPALNVAAEFTAMLTTLDATVAWIIANFPVSGGFLAALTFTADNTGRTQFRTLTSAQTAGLRTTLDALIATIE